MFSIIFYILTLNIFNISAFELCDNCIPKCCPMNQYVQRKRCTEPIIKKNFNISSYPVYSTGIHLTGKSLGDYFKVAEGKFSNETFRAGSESMNRVGFNIYLIEDRSMFLELPNAFQRWIQLQPSNYCIDYISPGTKIHIWAYLEMEDLTEANVYMTTGMIISCVFLILVLIVYSLLRELRNLCGKVLMAYVASLLMAFMLLVVIQQNELDVNYCLGLTLSVYYSFIASFCWMNVMSYDIWWTFRGYAKARPIHRRGETFKFCMYCLYAFGVPLAMSIFLAVINNADMRHVPWFVTPQIPLKGCFLEEGQKLLYLYVPMLIMNLFNWVFFLMTAFNIWRLSRGTAVLDSAAAGTPAAHRSQRHRLMVYLKLSILMGLNWVLEVVSSFKPELRVWYITDAYNMLIGVSIFLIFVCKKKILKRLVEELQCCRRGHWSPYSKSRSSATTVSNTSQDATQISSNPKGTV
ncbi:G-protein coupled receptor Mth2 [Amyelois transitella]|uniref:G-protein coupled receptor Mth2 n=1 Tax=Amyelois transitella TaxID=680683 RepID=UPI00067BF7A0|nr:G-protein coupled receptor Mth2 [Amyelois transitella]